MAQLRIEGGGERQDLPLPATSAMVYLAGSRQSRRLQLVEERPERYLAALLHTGGHWLVLAPLHGDGLAIDGVPVPSLKILDDQSVLTVAGFELRLAERVEEVLTADSRVLSQSKVCPWCQVPFAAKDSVIYCPTCGLAHHAKCLGEGGRCGSYPFCGYRVPAAAEPEAEMARR